MVESAGLLTGGESAAYRATSCIASASSSRRCKAISASVLPSTSAPSILPSGRSPDRRGQF